MDLANVYSIAAALGATPSKLGHFKPVFQLRVNDVDITSAVESRLVSLSIADKRGFEADTLDVTLSDHDGALELPPRGAVIQVWLGYAHSGLVYKGAYVAGCAEHSGAPDVVTINAIASEFSGAFTAQKERSFNQITLGTLVRQIADAHHWTPVILPELDAQLIAHIDQQQESDAALLTRIAKDFDAICAVKDGRLLFTRAGKATTASGRPIPPVIITRNRGGAGERGDQHRFAFSEAGEYTGVEAYWHNGDAGKRCSVRAKRAKSTTQKTKGKKEAVSVGAKATNDADKIKKLRHTYPTREAATRAATAEWARLQRGVATLSLTLARGVPTLFPETPVIAQGFKDVIDAQAWVVTNVTHSLSDSGYTCSVELECAGHEEGVEVEHAIL